MRTILGAATASLLLLAGACGQETDPEPERLSATTPTPAVTPTATAEPDPAPTPTTEPSLGRPSVAEISAALQDPENTTDSGVPAFDAESADCLAELFYESDLSDEGLRALVDGDEDYEDPDDEAAAQRIDEDELVACILSDLEIPDLDAPDAG